MKLQSQSCTEGYEKIDEGFLLTPGDLEMYRGVFKLELPLKVLQDALHLEG